MRKRVRLAILTAAVAVVGLTVASCRDDGVLGVGTGLGGVCRACQSDSDCESPLTCGNFGKPFSQCGYPSITCAVNLEGGTPDGNQGGGGGVAGGGGAGGGGGGGADGGASDGAATDAFWSPEAAGVMAPLATPNGYPVTALAANNTTGTLYAAMADLNGNNAGIAVFSSATNALIATIQPPPNAGAAVPPYAFNRLVGVDTAANLIYAVRLSSYIVDVFDGNANRYVTSINLNQFDINCPTGGSSAPGLEWLAVDPSRALVYLSCPVVGGTPPAIYVVVLSTLGLASDAGPTDPVQQQIYLSDLQSPFGAFALDTTNQLLYVANSVPGVVQSPAPPLLVDVLDTSSFIEDAGAQQSLGSLVTVGMLGGSGAATLVAAGAADGGVSAGIPGVFYSLEPSGTGTSLPITPANYELGSGQDAPGVYWVIGTEPSVAQGPVVSEIGVFADAGPQVLGQTPFTTPVPAGTPILVQGFVAGSVYSYLNGAAIVDGGSLPFAWAACLP